ncbi:ABC transporter ATP-binding protein [Clostridium sp. AL.422]|uniref:ABC transporter ATP-binding protein n=1 Tax=Clostridium TaxID=1485 RepID=UPI00293DC397|nr:MULTISPECIES: ABC transporter ATP-binding protein [unclassified Clostridium]MDV4149413.1 ABC transporter ATP-binding protein [Clostridium sp. AL.422]
MNVIEINNLTKDYGDRKGIFSINFSVKKGEVLGFLGPNGAGKTTTIRHLMGFSKADKGSCSINGSNCFDNSSEIQKYLGYLPGEIAFLDDMTGIKFIKFVAEMKGIKDLSRAKELIERFELNPKGKIKKMSKGMKQKIGIVCAFMQEPEILILDEPTSGLDPLMQNEFIKLIAEEKEKGRTILMSSHNFEEVEKACDRAAIIKEGKIVAVENISTLKESKQKIYNVTFENSNIANKFGTEGFKVKEIKDNNVTVSIKGDITPFIKALGKYKILNLESYTQSLEDLFMHYYGGENND